jgi:hypothetical protein
MGWARRDFPKGAPSMEQREAAPLQKAREALQSVRVAHFRENFATGSHFPPAGLRTAIELRRMRHD